MNSFQKKNQAVALAPEVSAAPEADAQTAAPEAGFHSAPVHDRDLISLMLTLQPEVVRVAILTAMEATVANALATRQIHANARMLIKYFPRESAKLMLASQRLGRIYSGMNLQVLLSSFNTALSRAKNTTLEFAAGGFVAKRQDRSDVADLAARWRQSCAAAHSLLTTLHEELGLQCPCRDGGGRNASCRPSKACGGWRLQPNKSGRVD